MESCSKILILQTSARPSQVVRTNKFNKFLDRVCPFEIIDHFFFALAIAIKTYFQKIADPADIAATASVSFTINHVAAVILPILLGILWLVSPAAVFLIGSGIALLSLLLSLNVPTDPTPGNEVVVGLWGVPRRAVTESH